MQLFARLAAQVIREVLKDIGQRLREERKRKGWTVKELADMSGAALNSIRNYEDGIHSAKLELLLVFQDLGIDIGYVLTGKRASTVTGEREQQLIDKFVRLDDQQKGVLLAMASSLLNESFDLNPFVQGDRQQPTLHNPRIPFKPQGT